MFDIFGEFDSVEELNKAAEGLFNENDMDNILVLAKENGIPEDFANLYITGDIPELSDVTIAAMGKIDMELPEAVKAYGDTADCVAEYIKSLCDREKFASMVRRKSRTLIKCLENMKTEAEKQIKTRSGCQCACIPPSSGYRMIREYYEGGQDQ
ncbi:Cas9 inhibitor AcrIIA9 family protein [Lacrimispora defluvii]|uniref:Uncharacterized protein n=1 Tax=Lacrimispora defluvii TaxID=2719233 RepID=A0ABX1VW54_9FIRM|nr:Cas9 inhibitor AcrIIA9 family protein [Lacrimispora defluvii]NNJ32665.1 hypothetical protein [Lacrimispora defluvii]